MILSNVNSLIVTSTKIETRAEPESEVTMDTASFIRIILRNARAAVNIAGIIWRSASRRRYRIPFEDSQLARRRRTKWDQLRPVTKRRGHRIERERVNYYCQERRGRSSRARPPAHPAGMRPGTGIDLCCLLFIFGDLFDKGKIRKAQRFMQRRMKFDNITSCRRLAYLRIFSRPAPDAPAHARVPPIRLTNSIGSDCVDYGTPADFDAATQMGPFVVQLLVYINMSHLVAPDTTTCDYRCYKHDRNSPEVWFTTPQNRAIASLYCHFGKVVCGACGGKCSGEVLRVSDKYFHTACFKCRTCNCSLAKGGFFAKDGQYYCPQDYQRAFGTRCAACEQYVEGEVVSALGNTYHQKCFTCARCKQAFPSGEKVTYTGAEVLCARCVSAPLKQTARASASASPTQAAPTPVAHTPRHNDKPPNENECAGCGQELSEGQALVALDRQWHTWCFACGECGAVLSGEYMGRDGVPYCERDYQRLFGVRCAYCQRYISGKVLQAGENHHFHPTCARCSKCGDPFGDGEEMFLQGAAIWHPRCGPAPGADPLASADRASSELQFSLRSRTPSVNGSYYSPYNSLVRKHGYRAISPGLVLREYRDSEPVSPHCITTFSYLTSEPAYLRRPLQPYDRPPASPHFHRPPSAASTRASSRPGSKASSRPGMRVLVDSIRSETPRPKSPHMNNEEPIELSHYPAAYKPPPGVKSKIERDDFPAPPYPYTDPERRRRWSDTYKGVPDSDEDETDGRPNGKVNGTSGSIDPKLRREEQELSKIDSGIAQVFLKEVKEREKIQQWKKQNLDPRNASRTPSASVEPTYRLRYSSPVGASPSRNLDHPRPADSAMSHPYYTHSSHSHIPSYNVHAAPRPGYGLKSSTLPARVGAHHNGYHYRNLALVWCIDGAVVSSLRQPPRPGYGLAARSHTFSSSTGADFSFSGMGDKTHSTDFSSGKSDISAGSITDVDRSAMTTDGTVTGTISVRGASAAAVGVRGGTLSSAGVPPGTGSAGVRRSLPNMATSALLHEPAKLYPYHLLLITNYRLPPDVDRLNLERHLSDAEFEAILQVSRHDFYRLPQWRRNELKRRARLF
ncbi:Actin-binding LIM protein 1 [Eumeta japonica]|uniref:Actin-binding LIM protein 1 n=1 Tax=Eumeta variegata TaxID=151549 RepID=A0A4C1US58_EUMVA|nr:Actin-binding LIM protein 1 [Eumeta japonica]